MAERITGLGYSGLDIDILVKNLMKTESTARDKLIQKRQYTEWKRDAFREMNTQLSSLRALTLNMKLASSYKMFTTASSDTAVLSATAGTSAQEGSYKIMVDKLATATQRKSTDVISKDIQSTEDITDFDFHGKSFSISFNGVQKTISWGDSEGIYTNIDELQTGLQSKIDNMFGSNNIEAAKSGDQIVLRPKDSTYKPNIIVTSATENDALSQLNIAAGTSYQISLDTKLQDLQLRTGALTFTEEGKLDFTINGQNFQVEKTKTLRDLINTVNASTRADVTISYDTAINKFIMKRDSSGAGVALEVSDNNETDFLSKLNMVDAASLTAGENAIIDFTGPNGISMTNLEMSSNNFTIQGVNLNLLKADVGVEKTVTVTKDVSTIYNNIKNFIDKYNEVLEKINTKYSEERDRDYQPLTDDQRESMTEDQIKAWEAKAKSGIIRSDMITGGIINDFRNAMSNPIAGLSGSIDRLSAIGITSGSYNEGGKLYINETKLKQAISENLDEVANIFSAAPTDLQSSNLSGTIDVEGKDFQVTLNGLRRTITLSGSYDLDSSTGRTEFLSELQGKLNTAFGSGQVLASYSNGKLLLMSGKGYTMKLNSGTTNDALAALGFNDGDTFDSSKKGIAARLYDKILLGGGKLTSKAGASTSYYDTSTLGLELVGIAASITKMNKRLSDIESRYYARFTAMETALSRLDSQSAWLSQQLMKS